MSKARNSEQIASRSETTVDGRRLSVPPQHPTQPIDLRVSDLRKSFASPSGEMIEVLRGASFHAAAGESIAITGASGAGKSTLLHLLAGLEEPDHGRIEAGEFAIHNASLSALAAFRNRSLGLVFQFHHLLKDLTALENVSLPLLINRHDSRSAVLKASGMLENANLSNRSAHLIGDLSGGEQQRVAVCRALVNRPSVVLADEPTGNLDAEASEAIGALLVDYARKTPAILIVATHNMSLASICDRHLILHEGRLSEN